MRKLDIESIKGTPLGALLEVEKSLPKSLSNDEYVETLNDFFYSLINESVDQFVIDVYTGKSSLPFPDEIDTISDSDKLKIFNNWQLINKIVCLSDIIEDHDEDEEKQPTLLS